jgi:hypothetical protein
MRRDFSYLPPVVSILLLFSGLSYGQAWSGILAPSRAIDWSHAGLPSTITYGTGGSACDGSTANCVETTANPWTPPIRVQCGSTINPTNTSSDVTNINNAIAACKPGSYILLGGNGTVPFDINANISFANDTNNYSGVSLRGSGPQNTILKLSGSGTNIQFGVCCGGGFSGSLTATSYASGTSTVTITGSGSAPQINQVAWFNQCDNGFSGSPCAGTYSDPGTIWICGVDYSVCAQDGGQSGTHNYETQYVLITRVTNNGGGSYTVTFTPGLYMPDWSSNRSARLTGTNPIYFSKGAGLEDLTVNIGYQQNTFIGFGNTYGSWIKGIRLIGSPTNSALSTGTLNDLLLNNYIFAQSPSALSTAASEPIVRNGDSSSLVLNNIITAGNCIWGDGQLVGEVLAYNYCRDSSTPYYIAPVALNHNPFQSFLLDEGNEGPELHDDDTHGTNGLDTYFRNFAEGWDPPYVTLNPWAVGIDNYQRFDNLIGNALGGPMMTGYQGTSYSSGYEYVIATGDSLSGASLMRWGNCDVINAGCRFVNSEVPTSLSNWPNSVKFQNPVPSNNDLPCSFFISSQSSSPCTVLTNGGTGLNWWKVCTSWANFPTSCSATQTQPFPPIGPEASGGPYVNGHAYDIPAAVAYKYLPIDATLQNSFTITGSTWSSSPSTCAIVSGGPSTGKAPCEILTVSLASINNGSAEHIMGGFQISGVNSACVPPGSPPNGEILMTGSNTSQIAYSLPTNPGVSCAGTLKFPDIRQFDERVYQDDPGGDPSVNPPSGLNAVVQ